MKDGLSSWCKPCRKKYETKSRYERFYYFAKGMPRMNVEDYKYLLEMQNNKCAICGTEVNQDSRGQRLCIDHDDKRKIVRGILCHLCNRGLGHFKDKPENLRKAAEYLEKYI